jgi:hypothetical protein
MKKNYTLFPLKYWFIVFFSLFASMLWGQEIPVTFKIVNQKRESVAFASVSVIKRADSTQVDKKVADSSGITVFNLSKGIQYTITVSSVDYQSLEKGVTVSSNQNTFIFTLEALGKTLGGVVVRSSRPLMRQEDDKTIVDPENLVASSTNGYEVIEKTPGLFVDQDGNIYISSTTPATILINGREMKMSTSDIATMLKSLPPNSIASIEIVRTPSAKYDASGSGGVVNVILKKGVKIGLTGSANTGWQQGTYGNQFVGLNLNNNNGKLTSYVNLNYSKRTYFERIKTDRLFAADTILSQDAYTKYPSSAYYLGFGLGYEINKKWEVSYDGRFSLNQFNNKTENLNNIEKVSTAQTIVSSLNRIDNKGNSFILNQGANLKNKIDSAGSEWTTDVSYTYATNNTDQFFNSAPNFGGYGNIDNKRHFFSAQTDLSLKLPHKLTLEGGAKTSVLNFNSITKYFKAENGSPVEDDERTNTFRYNENINALYVQASKTIVSDLILKLGTRMENTNMNGHQVFPDDTTFSIHRTDFFPYVYLSKKVIAIAGFELRAYLVYRRTITRPVYEQLNPFPRLVDQFLSEQGNPSLRPQFNNNYEANVSVNETPILAIGINQTKDIFTNVIYSEGSQAFRTYDNLGRNKEFYIRGLGAIPPGGKYFFVLGAQYNHNYYQGFYEKTPLSFKKGSWTFFTYHTLKVGTRSNITMNGFVRLKGQLQFYELSSFGSLNLSINRQFLNRKLIVTISGNDIFYTNKNDFVINQGSVKANGYRIADSRRFGINIRYNFGIRKKDDSNNMFNVESPEKSN